MKLQEIQVIICSDKKRTLTINRMIVQDYIGDIIIKQFLDLSLFQTHLEYLFNKYCVNCSYISNFFFKRYQRSTTTDWQ